MNDSTQNQTIAERLADDKTRLLEALKKMPIVQVACQQTGIGRTTYYNWRRSDKEFAKAADEAILEGELFLNDLSESQLISLVKDKNFNAIMAWLRHHHPKYAAKLEISGTVQVSEELTPEQEALVLRALKLASLTKDDDPLIIHPE